MVDILVQRLHPDVAMPERAHPGDAGLDLHAAEDRRLEPGERAAVPTGVAVAIPEGWCGLVVPRSGIALRHGLSIVNSPGLIDAGYRGEIKVILVNLDPRDAVEIRLGDRIAQLVLLPAPPAAVREVEELPPSDRGAGGFGSTGR